jgi:Ca2+-binding EF-hand superfamily protein
MRELTTLVGIVIVTAIFVTLYSNSSTAQTFSKLIDRVSVFDTNKDGLVSEREYLARCAKSTKAAFAKADRNGNGQLSQIEIRQDVQKNNSQLFAACPHLKRSK